MGKKGLLSAVKKAFVPSNDSKDKKEHKTRKAVSKSWLGKFIETESSHAESASATPANRSSPPEPKDDLKSAEPEPESSKPKEPENEPIKPTEPENEPKEPGNEPTKPEIEPTKPTKPEIEPTKPTKPDIEPIQPTKPDIEPTKPTQPEIEPTKPTKPENEPTKPEIEQKRSAKTENEQKKTASTIAFATSKAAVAAAVVRRFLGKSKEEVAAIKVQTAFRRYSARKKLRALKGLIRLEVLLQSQSVKRQAVTTLRCMQTLARVQSQVRARRIRMTEENQALQRQLLQKREREIDHIRSSLGTEWDNTRRSKEQIEASLLHREEAAARREKALAYAQTQQQMWRNPSKSANPTFMDPNNPQWGWSWLDRWMAARPWESHGRMPNGPQSLKLTRSSSVGDMSKQLDTGSTPGSPSARRAAPSSPKGVNDPTQLASPHNRRHSIAHASFRDEPSGRASSSSSSPQVTSPRSTKTKSMIPTPSQSQSPSRSSSPTPSPLVPAKKGTTEKKSTGGTVNRRLSLSGVPPSGGGGGSGRRLSGSASMGSGFR